MHAGAQDRLRRLHRRIAELLGGEVGLHRSRLSFPAGARGAGKGTRSAAEANGSLLASGSPGMTVISHPAYMRPGLRMPAGSKAALRPAVSCMSGGAQGLEHVHRGAQLRRRAHQRRVAALGAYRSTHGRRAGIVGRVRRDPEEAAAPVVEPAASRARAHRRDDGRPLGRRHRDAPDARPRGSARGATSRTARQSASAASPSTTSTAPKPVRSRRSAPRPMIDGQRKALEAQQRAPAGAVEGRRQMRRAGHLEGRGERRRTAPRSRAASSSLASTSVATRLRPRQHLEGHLGEDAERAPGAGHQLDEVEAGDVLHDAAAGLDHLAAGR